MAEKVIILKVDLSCARCRKKMEKILKKHQDEWNIKKVNWDTKDNKITLSGPFNTDELIKNLCCKACKTIKEVIIPDPPKPAAAKPAPEPPKPAAKPPKPAPEPPKPAAEPPKPAAEPPKPAAEPPKPAAEPPKPAPEPPKPELPTTIHLTGQLCLCGPCHANQKPCNCDCSIARKPCSCDGGYWLNYPPYPAYPPYPPYPPASYTPAYGRPTCQYYCEDEPGVCAIM